MIKEDKLIEKWEFIATMAASKKNQYWDFERRRFREYDYYYFADRRINAKFNEIVETYSEVIDRDMLFDYSKEIIEEIVLKKEYVYISKNEKKDDISFIITTLEQRINDKINVHRGTYITRRGGKTEYITAPYMESLDEVFYNSEGEECTLYETVPETSNVFYTYDISDEQDEESLKRIALKAKLTDREIEVLRALERTRDNINQGTYYNKAEASRLLGDCSRENVTKIFTNIKRKVSKSYKISFTRQDKINELNDLLDSVDDEIDIIKYINENLEDDLHTYKIFYSVDGSLIQYFIKNRYNESTYKSDNMRKFVTYFIKEIYDYIELLKKNYEISKGKEELRLIS